MKCAAKKVTLLAKLQQILQHIEKYFIYYVASFHQKNLICYLREQ